jgi:hypothetical protein
VNFDRNRLKEEDLSLGEREDCKTERSTSKNKGYTDPE